MSQTINHQVQTGHWQAVLQRHCPAATVASDLTMPYRRGDKTRVLVPDLFVALRAERRGDRRSYRLWENPLPDLVIEMLSETTYEADIGSKWRTYEFLRVREYYLFDPDGFELSTPLVGYRLRGTRYGPVRANAAGRLPSRVLGLELHVLAGRLRFRDPKTGEDLTTYEDAEDGRMAEKHRADAEKHRADAEKRRADEAEARAEAAERALARIEAARR